MADINLDFLSPEKREFLRRRAEERGLSIEEELDRAMSLLTKRASKATALRIAEAFILSSEACLLDVTAEDFDAAWALFTRYPDWDFDLIDAISFALTKREEIETALTFDSHFAQMGFETLRG